MTESASTGGGSGLEQELEHWIGMEAGDRELQDRVAPALEEIRAFVERHRSELERRKGRLIQTSAFRDESQAMEEALAGIGRLLAAGRNVSAIFSVIDGFLDRHPADATLDRESIRVRLAEARDDQVCRLHDAVRGTRLAELLGVLYFLPYSSWRWRGLERRCFRAPSSAEVRKVLAEGRRRGVDVDGMDPAELAALVRIRLGIAPRMDYHRMGSNKLAERLIDEETLARLASAEVPFDPGFCRPADRMLADIRRWSAECLGGEPGPAPAEIEAEMLQIAYCASDLVRLGGTGKERQADFLWLLATVVASGQAMLGDVLARFFDRHSAHPPVRERITAAKRYLDAVAPTLDAMLEASWNEAREELDSLIARSEDLVSRSSHAYGEFTELEGLKERRSDVVKSLIKLSDSIRLVEPGLLESPPPPGAAAVPPGFAAEPGPPDPARLRDRNARIAGETNRIARQELVRLRELIGRMAAISRKGFGEAADREGAEPRRERRRQARVTSDGVDLGGLAVAELGGKLRGALVKTALSLREIRGKVEGVRRRNVRGELQQALNVLNDRTRRAVETCEGLDPEDADAVRASADAEGVVTALRDLMAAHAQLGARVGAARLTPAEKPPLTALIYVVKTRLGEDLRDLERLRAELAERSAGGPDGGTAEGVAAAGGEDLAAAAAGAPGSVEELADHVNRALLAKEADGAAVARVLEELRGGLRRARGAARATVPLAGLEEEAEALAKAVEALAGVERALADAAAHERGLSEALRPPPRRQGPREPFVPIRERCARALAALPQFLEQVRQARGELSGAAGVPWATLEAAPGYLEARAAGLATAGEELEAIRSRIEEVHLRFKSDRPRPGPTRPAPP